MYRREVRNFMAQYGTNGTRKRSLDSTATSSSKRPKLEANDALLEEIREINQRLMDIVVGISDEHVEGIIVKCSFIPVALGPRYASARMSPIEPLRLLVPTNYPNSSSVLLDKLPVQVSEDLSEKAKSRFNTLLRSLPQPMSLGAMARTWGVCARAVISELAQKRGGGSLFSKYGTLEYYRVE